MCIMTTDHRLLINLLLGFGAISSASATPVKFEGTLQTHHFQSPGRSALERTVNFSIEVDSVAQTWKIEDLSHPTTTAYRHNETIVHKLYTPERSTGLYEVSQFENEYPIDLQWDQRILWFVYCAGDFLREREGSPVILPFGDPRMDAYLHAIRMENVTWREKNDICPEQAEFRVDLKLLDDAHQSLSFLPLGNVLTSRAEAISDLANVLTNGQVMAKLEVLVWTNWSNSGVPREWRILRFASSGKLNREYRGVLQNVSDLDSVAHLALTTPAEIVDKRVRGGGVNSVGYVVADGSLPARDSDRVQTLVREARTLDRFTLPPDKTLGQHLIVGLIAFLLLLPILIWCLRLRVRKPTMKG